MISTTIIKQTMRENVFQPIFIFAIIIGVALIALITFGLSLQFENHVLVSARLFGSPLIEEHVTAFVETFAFALFGLSVAILMFLFVMACSFFYPDLLKSPLLSVMLTKPVTRIGLFMSKFSGLCLLVLSYVLTLSVMLWGVLCAKTDGNIPVSVILGGISFFVEFILMFAFASLLAMLVENSTGVTILATAVYFYIAPLVANADEISAPVKVLSLLIPPVGHISKATRNLILSNEVNVDVYLFAIFYAILFIGAAAFLFHRRDIG